jgi:hypothetical protein
MERVSGGDRNLIIYAPDYQLMDGLPGLRFSNKPLICIRIYPLLSIDHICKMGNYSDNVCPLDTRQT